MFYLNGFFFVLKFSLSFGLVFGFWSLAQLVCTYLGDRRLQRVSFLIFYGDSFKQSAICVSKLFFFYFIYFLFTYSFRSRLNQTCCLLLQFAYCCFFLPVFLFLKRIFFDFIVVFNFFITCVCSSSSAIFFTPPKLCVPRFVSASLLFFR